MISSPLGKSGAVWLMLVSSVILFICGCNINIKDPSALSGLDQAGRLSYPLYLCLPLSPAESAEGGWQRNLHHSSGQVITVRKFPLIWSASFPTIEVIEQDEGSIALRAVLDRQGRFAWKAVMMERPGQRLAVAVGDTFKFFITVPPVQDDVREIIIRGPWNRYEANLIAERAARNYKTIHRL